MKILVTKVLLLLLGISMEIELCAAKSDTCRAKYKCRKEGGLCQPKDKECAGQRREGSLYCKDWQTCDCCAHTCSATTQHKCRKVGGLCQPKDKECAGPIRKGRKYCKDSKTCDCCAPCSKGTKLPCKDLKGTCINNDDPCNGYVIKNKAFCKQGRLCKCCIPGVTTQLTKLDPTHPPTTSSAACPTYKECEDAEGTCQPLAEKCDGELRAGHYYCKNRKECGCCIRKVCVWNSKEYVNGEETDDTCLILRCSKGTWKVTGERNHKCGVCQVYGDPHFRTFDPHAWNNHVSLGDTNGTYYYQGTGDVNITRNDQLPSFGVDSHFDSCFDPSYKVSCINSVSYFQPDTRIDLHINTDTCTSPSSCQIKVTKGGGSGLPIFQSLVGSVIGPQVNYHSCVKVVGSEGLSLMFCSVNNIYAYLYVWAMPFLKSSLYGLCDTYTGTERNCYTHEDGSCPMNPGGWDLKKRDQEICDFAKSWRHGEGRHCTSPIPSSPCDTNATLKHEISDKCNSVIPGTDPDQISCRASCVFDLCRVNDTESEYSYLKGYEFQANFN